jgi:hypothetical protein
MTDLTYDTFAARLRHEVPGFEHVYDEHVADYDEVLPHVLLGDLVRFLSREIEVRGAQSVAVRQAMSLLEEGMGSGEPRLQELVAVSFLENLDSADASFSTIRTLFGPSLEEQYRKYEDVAAGGVRPE